MTSGISKADGSPIDQESFEIGWQAAMAWLNTVVSVKDRRRLRDAQLQRRVDLSLLEIDIRELDLVIRTYNALNRERVSTIGDLIKWRERDVLLIRNIGKKSVSEINEALAKYGLCLPKD